MQNKAFPYYAYNIRENNSFPFNPYFGTMHHHAAIQLVLVVSGHITFKDIAKETVEVEQGQGIFINSQTIHEIIPHPGSHYFTIRFPIYFVQFYLDSPAQNLINQLLQQDQLTSLVLLPSIAWQKQCLQHLRQLSLLEQKPHQQIYPYQVLINLTEFFLLFLQNIPLNNVQKKKQVGIARMQTYLQFIKQHYAEALTLPLLAESANVSISVCLRDFHQYFDQTPYQYLNNYRLSQAANLLQNSDYSIAAIAEKTGFNSASYFSALFKKKAGILPKDYRSK